MKLIGPVTSEPVGNVTETSQKTPPHTYELSSSWSLTARQQCDNHAMMGTFPIAHHQFLIKFIFLHSRRYGNLTTLRTLSPWVQSRSYHDNQSAGLATLEVVKWAPLRSLSKRKNQRAANSPYNFALSHLLPAVRKRITSGGQKKSLISIHGRTFPHDADGVPHAMEPSAEVAMTPAPVLKTWSEHQRVTFPVA